MDYLPEKNNFTLYKPKGKVPESLSELEKYLIDLIVWQENNYKEMATRINWLIGNNLTGNSTWDGSHLVMGVYHLWIDATGDLRVKNSAPTSDLDGTIVGTQS